MKWKWFAVTALAASIGACALCSSFASAQPAPMRITDIGAIGAADGEFENSFSVNCRGEVCGSMIVNSERHAFLWLPQANYGLAANTLHDLTVLAGLPGYSVANDLNNNGIIVGEYEDGNGDKRGIVWNLPAWSGSPSKATSLHANSPMNTG